MLSRGNERGVNSPASLTCDSRIGKPEQEIKVVTDDGWLDTCVRFGEKRLLFNPVKT
jgi:hypothetical protein